MPNWELLTERLSYNPDTGVFTRRIDSGTWKAGDLAGWINTQGYWCLSVDGQTYLAHRVVFFLETGDWPKHEVDHIDGDRSNNKRDNLRLVERTQNAWNTPKYKNNTSGYRNVFWSPLHNKYRARFRMNGKQIEVGLFDNPEDASTAVIGMRHSLQGDYIRKEN